MIVFFDCFSPLYNRHGWLGVNSGYVVLMAGLNKMYSFIQTSTGNTKAIYAYFSVTYRWNDNYMDIYFSVTYRWNDHYMDIYFSVTYRWNDHYMDIYFSVTYRWNDHYMDIYFSVTYRWNDHYMDIYDCKVADYCQKSKAIKQTRSQKTQ